MILLDTLEAMSAALSAPMDQTLHALLVRRVAHTVACDLTALTHIVIVEPGDIKADLIREIGFSPTVNACHGTRFGDHAFTPGWDWHVAHDGWWELIVTVGNDGLAYIIYIPDVEGIDPHLRAVCRIYASDKAGQD